jgi:Domain of unknown function (DUF222)/HNH endonuclease
MSVTSEQCSVLAPGCAAEALAWVEAGLSFLASVDAQELTATEQAGALRALGRAESMHLAARSRVLSAFDQCAGFAGDGQGTARAWLRWQTRVSGGAASAAVGWMRRLAAHPEVAGALAGGVISVSFARCICDWTELLPTGRRAEADQILLAAAVAGAELNDLAALVAQMQRCCAEPDGDDGDGGFSDRGLRLAPHFGKHAHLDADLTPSAAAALQAVLDVFNAAAGPEDRRTAAQRDHDALEEACRVLIAGGLPDRAGQPTQIQLHMTLSDLLGRPEANDAVAAWIKANGAAAPPGADCDASIAPIVTGSVDPDLLAQLAEAIARRGQPGGDHQGQPGVDQDGRPGGGEARRIIRTRGMRLRFDTAEMADRAARYVAISQAIRLLSGPGGLASWLRTSQLPDLANSISLPLDVGKPTETIPPHLRRAIARRDKHCRFPGCDRPVSRCQVHHLIPRSQGGSTSLANCCELCAFHHLIAVHRWGWQLTLNPDGTTVATSPDGSKILRSHAPPNAAA